MTRLRSHAPTFIKKVVWNWKHRMGIISPSRCPRDLLECLNSLRPDANLLDLGCGAGNLRAALRLRGWKGRFIGIDVSETILDTARMAGDPNSEWHASTIEEFPFPETSVSVVCLCESIYYVKPTSVVRLLDRCRQVIGADGGRIVIRICHSNRHTEHIALLKSLGAQRDGSLFIFDTVCVQDRR
jgi:2-polyprenyl-3-methyl-5-hydroxy-6-metoxy-1,4-benzoquinol methylase